MNDNAMVVQANARFGLLLNDFRFSKALYDETGYPRLYHDYLYYVYNTTEGPMYSDFLALDLTLTRNSQVPNANTHTARDRAFTALIDSIVRRCSLSQDLVLTNRDVVTLRQTLNTQVTGLRTEMDAMKQRITEHDAFLEARASSAFDVNALNDRLLEIANRLNKITVYLQGEEGETDNELTTRSRPESGIIPLNLVASRLSALQKTPITASKPVVSSKEVSAPPPDGKTRVHLEFLATFFGHEVYFVCTGPTPFALDTILTCDSLEKETVIVDERLLSDVHTIKKTYVFETRKRLLVSFFAFVTNGKWPESEPTVVYKYKDFTRTQTPSYLRYANIKHSSTAS